MGLEYLKHVSAVEAVSLDELMDEYGDDVLKYAYAITKDRELAKDVAQDTFIMMANVKYSPEHLR